MFTAVPWGIRMLLPLSFTNLVLACFAPAMASPSALNLLLLLPGWILAPRRTITAMLQAAGLAGKLHHSRCHRLLANARWSLDKVGLALFQLILPHLPQDAVIFLVGDDTMTRCCPVAARPSSTGAIAGSCWACCCPCRFARVRGFCLPILFRLYRNQKTLQREHEPQAYHSRPELLVELLTLLCQAHPRRRFHLLVDATYSGASVVRKLPANCELTGRGHLDAHLSASAPPRPAGRRGPSPVRGQRLPIPRAILQEKDLPQVTLNIYGRRTKAALASCVALWYSVARGRPLRIVAVRQLTEAGGEETFFSTCLQALPVQVLIWYSWRWGIEVTNHEAKGLLGFEEPQGWSRKAVERTAPLAMVRYSLVVLWFAEEGHQHVQFPCRPWYRQKRTVSFADMLRTLRRLGLERHFVHPPEPGTPTHKSLAALIALASWIP